MEEQTKKTMLIVIAAAVVVAIVLAAAYFLIGDGGGEKAAPSTMAVVAPAPESEQAPAPAASTADATEPTIAAPEQQPPEDSKDAQLKRFALDFAARFGTYSSDAQAENLKQLMPLMSGELQTWAEKILASPASARAEKFTSVTSAALSAQIISQTSAHAVVEVSTQRSYVEGSEQRLAYEIATLSLAKSGTWKVESVGWKPRPE